MTNANVEKPYTDSVTGRFKKGNPGGGRPQGSYGLATILKKKLSDTIKINGIEAGKELIDVWLKKVKTEKEINALREATQYINRMPKQQTETSD